MTQPSNNPFVLPGFGQQGEAAQNPVFAGLDMMRQVWQNMAGAGSLDASVMPPLSLEDLDRRIRELQTVQNWLQLNATMLASTIQGLEIQRSTLATLRSFANAGLSGGGAPGGPAAHKPRTAGSPAAATPKSGGTASAGAAQADLAGQAYAQAAQDWWQLIRQQFDTLAAATQASLDGLKDSGGDAAASATAPATAPPTGTHRATPARAAAAAKTGTPRKAAVRKPRA